MKAPIHGGGKAAKKKVVRRKPSGPASDLRSSPRKGGAPAYTNATIVVQKKTGQTAEGRPTTRPVRKVVHVQKARAHMGRRYYARRRREEERAKELAASRLRVKKAAEFKLDPVGQMAPTKDRGEGRRLAINREALEADQKRAEARVEQAVKAERNTLVARERGVQKRVRQEVKERREGHERNIRHTGAAGMTPNERKWVKRKIVKKAHRTAPEVMEGLNDPDKSKVKRKLVKGELRGVRKGGGITPEEWEQAKLVTTVIDAKAEAKRKLNRKANEVENERMARRLRKEARKIRPSRVHPGDVGGDLVKTREHLLKARAKAEDLEDLDAGEVADSLWRGVKDTVTHPGASIQQWQENPSEAFKQVVRSTGVPALIRGGTKGFAKHHKHQLQEDALSTVGWLAGGVGGGAKALQAGRYRGAKGKRKLAVARSRAPIRVDDGGGLGARGGFSRDRIYAHDPIIRSAQKAKDKAAKKVRKGRAHTVKLRGGKTVVLRGPKGKRKTVTIRPGRLAKGNRIVVNNLARDHGAAKNSGLAHEEGVLHGRAGRSTAKTLKEAREQKRIAKKEKKLLKTDLYSRVVNELVHHVDEDNLDVEIAERITELRRFANRRDYGPLDMGGEKVMAISRRTGARTGEARRELQLEQARKRDHAVAQAESLEAAMANFTDQEWADVIEVAQRRRGVGRSQDIRRHRFSNLGEEKAIERIGKARLVSLGRAMPVMAWNERKGDWQEVLVKKSDTMLAQLHDTDPVSFKPAENGVKYFSGKLEDHHLVKTSELREAGAKHAYRDYVEHGDSDKRDVGIVEAGTGFSGRSIQGADMSKRVDEAQLDIEKKISMSRQAEVFLHRAYANSDGDRLKGEDAVAAAKRLTKATRYEWVPVRASRINADSMARAPFPERPAKGEDGFVVMPKEIARIWEKQVADPSRSFAAAKMLTDAFIRGVLPLSIAWYLGNATDLITRAILAGAKPGQTKHLEEILALLDARDPDAADKLRSIVGNVGSRKTTHRIDMRDVIHSGRHRGGEGEIRGEKHLRQRTGHNSEPFNVVDFTPGRRKAEDIIKWDKIEAAQFVRDNGPQAFLDEYIRRYGPYAFHYSGQNPATVLKEGIKPREEFGAGNAGAMWPDIVSAKDRVYLDRSGAYGSEQKHGYRIDLRKIDASKLSGDEDFIVSLIHEAEREATETSVSDSYSSQVQAFTDSLDPDYLEQLSNTGMLQDVIDAQVGPPPPANPGDLGGASFPLPTSKGLTHTGSIHPGKKRPADDPDRQGWQGTVDSIKAKIKEIEEDPTRGPHVKELELQHQQRLLHAARMNREELSPADLAGDAAMDDLELVAQSHGDSPLGSFTHKGVIPPEAIEYVFGGGREGAAKGTRKKGKRTTIGERFYSAGQVRGIRQAREGMSKVVDAAFDFGRDMEQRGLDIAQARALDLYAKDLGLKLQHHAALAQTLAHNPRNVNRFIDATLDITGDYLRRGPDSRQWQHVAVPFYSWIKAANKFVWKTLPKEHPTTTLAYIQAVAATEEQRKLLGLSLRVTDEEVKRLGLPKPRKSDVLGTPGAVVAPLSGLTSMSEASRWVNDPLEAAFGAVFPQVAAAANLFAGTDGRLGGELAKVAKKHLGMYDHIPKNFRKNVEADFDFGFHPENLGTFIPGGGLVKGAIKGPVGGNRGTQTSGEGTDDGGQGDLSLGERVIGAIGVGPRRDMPWQGKFADSLERSDGDRTEVSDGELVNERTGEFERGSLFPEYLDDVRRELGPEGIDEKRHRNVVRRIQGKRSSDERILDTAAIAQKSYEAAPRQQLEEHLAGLRKTAAAGGSYGDMSGKRLQAYIDRVAKQASQTPGKVRRITPIENILKTEPSGSLKTRVGGFGNDTQTYRPAGRPVQRTITAPLSPAEMARLEARSDVARVQAVIDGDTLLLRHDGDSKKVRIPGIDTPETVHTEMGVQAYAPKASKLMKELLDGQEVRVVFDKQRKDIHGRTLAYIYRASDGIAVDEELVRQGYALPLVIPPNVAHARRLQQAALAARKARRGLWLGS